MEDKYFANRGVERNKKPLHRPVPECVIELVASLNLSAQIKGKPKRAFIQANPQLN